MTIRSTIVASDFLLPFGMGSRWGERGFFFKFSTKFADSNNICEYRVLVFTEGLELGGGQLESIETHLLI